MISTLTDTNVSATFSLNLTNPNAPILVADAFFGLPLAVGFSLLGAPVSGLNGLATGATVLSAALQSGNPLAVGGALVDLPAYTLNGFLDGETIVDLTLPVGLATALPSFAGPLGPRPWAEALNLVFGITGITDPTIPIVAHLPFDGLLVPPQPVTATIPVSVAGVTTIDVNLTLGGTPFGGLIPALVNTVPRDLAAAIAPKSSGTQPGASSVSSGPPPSATGSGRRPQARSRQRSFWCVQAFAHENPPDSQRL